MFECSMSMVGTVGNVLVIDGVDFPLLRQKKSTVKSSLPTAYGLRYSRMCCLF